MEQQKKKRIFISYKRVDKDRVFAIKDGIEQATGEKCWIDLDGIESDAQFVANIMGAIDDCDVFLFMRSKEHNKIKRQDLATDWTIREVNYALEERKSIVFLNLDNTPMPKWFKFMFPNKQEIDTTDPEKLKHLYKDLCSRLNVEERAIGAVVKPKRRTTHKSWLWILLSIVFAIIMGAYGIYRYKNKNVPDVPEEYEIYVQDSIDAAHREALRLDSIRQQDYNGHEYVDLGLSVKWATCNVGATKPEEPGYYFAWGEITPNKTTYDWSTYKWCNGNYDSLTKYNNKSSYGTVDNKTQLELSDDVARANWGGSWRMPTDAELTELREKCTWTWTTQNGKNGYKVTSKSNGNSIFLPAAGYRYDSSLNYAGSHGDYWSSSLYTDSPYYAWYVGFNSGNVYRGGDYRYGGQSVRPVCP